MQKIPKDLEKKYPKLVDKVRWSQFGGDDGEEGGTEKGGWRGKKIKQSNTFRYNLFRVLFP
jgi:hypothetical protein